jgi:hypothetical protein
MARKTGKAARRQTRQKRAQRSAQRSAQPRPATPRATAPVEAEATTETTSGPAPAAAPANTPPAASSRPVGRRSRAGSRLVPSGSTHLGHLREDYHYVERDLRNIALLTIVMVLILAVATIAFNIFDLGPG